VNSRITSIDQLRNHYRQPHPLVVAKERPVLDAATQRFIGSARLLVIATAGADGTTDASPRGGPAGFVRVLDERTIAFADASGNNRLDSLTNIVETGQVGLLLIAPGHEETVRINGRAHLSIDPELLASFEQTHPRSVVVVEVAGTYIHCAKAFRRGAVWRPEQWPAVVPDGADVLVCQGVVDADVQVVRDELEQGYAADLAAEGHPNLH
jgi:PPOX class probable FMN-dependent enzyme